MSAKILQIAIFSLCLSPTFAQEKTENPSLLTTDKKPLIENKGRKKGLLGTISQNFDIQTGSGKKIFTEDGKLNKKDLLPSASIGAGGNLAGMSKSGELTTTDLGLKAPAKINKKGSSTEKNSHKKTFNGREYEDIGVMRQVFSTGSGDRAITHEFYVLKNDEEEPSKYVRDIYWYDYRGNRITNAVQKETDNVQIMHGPYHRYVGDELVEEGFYYLGAKHGRWLRYGKELDGDWALADRQDWDKGYAKGSQVSYYDTEKTKIKEVIPMTNGKVSGEYWAFFDSGLMAEEGRFQDSVKVGRWKEYHKFGRGGRTKKITQHAKDKYEDFEPYVVTEYDSNGKVIYDNKTAKKEEESENND